MKSLVWVYEWRVFRAQMRVTVSVPQLFSSLTCDRLNRSASVGTKIYQFCSTPEQEVVSTCRRSLGVDLVGSRVLCTWRMFFDLVHSLSRQNAPVLFVAFCFLPFFSIVLQLFRAVWRCSSVSPKNNVSRSCMGDLTGIKWAQWIPRWAYNLRRKINIQFWLSLFIRRSAFWPVILDTIMLHGVVAWNFHRPGGA